MKSHNRVPSSGRPSSVCGAERSARTAWILCRCALLSLFAFAAAVSSRAELVFSETFEGGWSAWTAGGTWGGAVAGAGTTGLCASDSPGAFYATSTDASLALASPVSLAGLSRPVLAFRHRYSLETDFDFGRVEISTDGGATWSAPLTSYSGEAAEFRDEQLDLAAYVGAPSFKVRFRLLTDDSVNRDGWYVDEVRIGDAPVPVTLAAPSAVGRTSVTLNWSPAAGSFSRYEIYRSTTPGLDWRAAWRVGTVNAQGTATFSDVTVSPKTTYYYRLVLVDADGLRAASNEVSVTTLAGMDFPLLDNGEGGTHTWAADAPWALSAEQVASGTHAWSDSPGGNYAPSIGSQSLTLASPVNLTATNHPVLCFNHRFAFAGGDYGLVEVSTNNGTDWTVLLTAGGVSDGWQRGRLSLAAYKQAAVLVRFRVTSDSGDTADGWHVDDISLSEAPPTVPVPIVTATGSTTVSLSWQASADPMFSHYLVCRSKTAGTGLNSTLAAKLSGAGNTSFTDTGLLLDTTYCYRVYAVNSYGGISADSPTEAQVRTLNNPPPFTENFEGSLSAWLLNGSWAVTAESAHGGTRALTDSPLASYLPGSDTYAETSVDLRGASWPVLTFWDRYAMGAGDWARVEVYDANETWVSILPYGVSDGATRPEWRRQQVDLSPLKGRGNVRIRFRVATDGGTPGDGWFIDDVAVVENPLGASPQTLPFTDNFEDGLDAWLASSWSVAADGSAKDGAQSALSSASRMGPDTHHPLELAHPLVLPAGSNVQMTFSVRGALEPGSWFRVQYSADGGVSWPEITSCNLDHPYNSGGEWTRLQASLAGFAGQTIRLRIVTNSDRYGRLVALSLDKLTLAPMPAAVTLSSAIPAVRSVALTWTPSTLGAAFRRYEVWRSTAANVTVQNGTKLFASTDLAATNFTDTGLAIGVQYFYRVFTVDDRDTFIPSNELAATTVPSLVPFADVMDTMGNWVPGSTGAPNTWGTCTDNPHSGSGCLAVAPTGQYAINSDTWVETAVDLRGASWPVLTFWDRYAMGAGDWARVEVYDANETWVSILPYGVSDGATRPEWRRQQVDLSPLKGRGNVRIRFRVGTDGGTPGAGWFIDDLSIAENPLGASPQTLPFTDNFEGGLDAWFASSWSVAADGSAKDGAQSALSSASRMGPDTHHPLELAHPLVLPAGSNVQMTFSVRGALDPGSWFRVQYSADGGVSWPEITSCNLDHPYNSGGEWTRLQASLAGFAGQTIRLRIVTNSDRYGRLVALSLDKLTLAPMPAAVTLSSAIPAVRSVALTWTPSTLGAAFRRYEVWRSTAANVTVQNGTKLFASTDLAATNFTDTGLAIGVQYFYRVFTVDDRDTFIPSNELAATTVPSLVPFADAMDTTANWVPGGNTAPNTWGTCTDNSHSGSGCLAVAPTGQYAINSDTWVETAVDLRGASWPVLTFWDRYAMGAGDWARVEVYDANETWVSILPYGVSDGATRPEWRRQQVDLSPLKGRGNVRIRFRVATDGGTPGAGWFIDDLSIAENPLGASPQTLPFTDNFEGVLDAWLASSWLVTTDAAAKDGAQSALSCASRMGPDTHHPLELAHPLVLPVGSNVQVTFSVRGSLEPGSWFRVQYSADGGVSWPEIASCNLDHPYNSGGEWTRLQASLAGFAGQTIRLRIVTNSDRYGRLVALSLDKLTIAPIPAAVNLTSAEPALRSVALTWTPSTLGAAFRRYEVWRSTAANVTVQNGTKVFASTDPAVTNFTDTGLSIGVGYFYRVFVVDERDTFIPSNEMMVTTVPSVLPFSDPMDGAGNWVPGTTGATNTWGVCTDNPHSGSGCLAVAPIGQYADNADTWIETTVDLRGTTWPVLTFWDRYAIGAGDWMRLEVYDANETWIAANLYGVCDTAARAEWRRQQVDLSPFKGRAKVRLRFRVGADGGTPGAGWFIDDVTVGENPLAATAQALPLFDSFEAGTGNWIASGWNVQNDASAPDGTRSVYDTESVRTAPDTQHMLTLARPLTVPAGSAARVTFKVRGYLDPGSWFRLQYSADGGVSWPELNSCNLDGPFGTSGVNTGWTRLQASLAGFAGQTIRLRVLTGSDRYARSEDIWIDSFGIGEQAPLAPIPLSPIAGAWVPVVRPTLRVQNAVDLQSDALTYRFEVYSDAAMSNLVSQVPAVASGATTTPWQVDVDLPNNTQYWWRARANDTVADGPWSAGETFYVNEVNHPPAAVVQYGPANGAILYLDSDLLFWRESTDVDVGDVITTYQIQVSKTSDFAAPVIDDAAITAPPALGDQATEVALAIALGSLTNGDKLVDGTAYYWRIRAADNRGGWSAWQTTPRYFRFFTTPPTAFNHWQARDFNADDLNRSAVSSAGADPDGDGQCNLLEFAAGTAARDASSSARPVVQLVGGFLQITYRQYTGGSGVTGVDYLARDLRYAVEISDSLAAGSWRSGATEVEFIAGSAIDNGDGTETVTVRAKIPVASAARQFLRLNVSTVAP